MIWAPLLHLYQPPTQFPEVLKRIAEESYIPLVDFLERNSKAKITLNINASLSEQLADLGFEDVLRGMKDLAQRGQVELLGSGAYHPLLTRIPFSEISRQVRLNEKINRELIGEVYKPHGFFPPELAYSQKVADAVSELGYDWILVEDAASSKQPVKYDRFYTFSEGNLDIAFRHKKLSLAIAFGKVSSADEFLALAKEELSKDDYILTAMDGETFGHHKKDAFSFLEDLYSKIESSTVSKLFSLYPKREEADPMESTWGASHEDCLKGHIYPRWDNPGSPLHEIQWELYRLAVTLVEGFVYKIPEDHLDGKVKEEKLTPDQKQWLKARHLLDKALHSDQFWWASRNPIWHPGMVERGTKLLLDTIISTPDISKLEKKRAKDLYEEITTRGIELYGEEPILG